MNFKYLSFLIILSFSGLQAQMFRHYSAGLSINTFFHQQGINYYLGTSDEKGQLYFIHYDTISSGFQYGKEFSTVRLQIFNGLSWLNSKPVKLFSRNTVDAPRVLDLHYFKGKVYLAGSFDSSSNNMGSGLIAFDGSEWVSTNADLMQVFPDYFEVKQILNFDGNLFITGNFDSIPGLRVNGLLWHDGITWKPVGQSPPFGFRNLSGTGNVFFKVVNDSLYAYNKNKINPDSIEIGGTVAKKLAVFSDGGFIQAGHNSHLITAFAEYNQALISINSTEKLYTTTLSVRQGNSWTDYLFPDSFYTTNYTGSFEKNGELYFLFQSPSPAEMKVYKFNGTEIKLFRIFKISSQYLNLDFFSENGYHVLSGQFNETVISDYKERHNRVLGLLFEPLTQISGFCFHDNNLDGNYQTGEAFIGNCKIYDNNNTYLATTDVNGRYNLNIPSGSVLTLNAISSNGLVSSQSIAFNPSSPGLITYNFALQGSNTDDIGVFITSQSANKARQGFVSTYFIDVINYSGVNKSLNVLVNHNSKLSQRIFKDFSPISAGQDQFVFAVNLEGHSSKRYFFEGVYAVDSFELGEPVIVSTKSLLSDNNPNNNSDTVFQIVKAAFDPNIKVANPEIIVNKEKLIQYVIWFQNEGNDTALNVTVVDTFGTLFDLSAVYLGHNSHPCEIEVINNCILWHFRGIKLPPKSQDSSKSIGFVSFRSKLTKQAVLGDTIINKAAIFFDYQKPIITNRAKVLFDKPSSITGVKNPNLLFFYPNPFKGVLYYENSSQSNIEVEIWDISGRIIFEAVLTSEGELIFPENSSDGLYVIRDKQSGLALGKILLIQ